jgi:hypothetical protein
MTITRSIALCLVLVLPAGCLRNRPPLAADSRTTADGWQRVLLDESRAIEQLAWNDCGLKEPAGAPAIGPILDNIEARDGRLASLERLGASSEAQAVLTYVKASQDVAVTMLALCRELIMSSSDYHQRLFAGLRENMSRGLDVLASLRPVSSPDCGQASTRFRAAYERGVRAEADVTRRVATTLPRYVPMYATYQARVGLVESVLQQICGPSRAAPTP